MRQSDSRAFLRLAHVAAAWVAAVVLWAGVLTAQETSGKIEGTLRDPAGAPVQGAQVFIVGTAFAAVSNERGYYFINNVPAGVFIVRAQYIGFAPAEARNVRVYAGQTLTVDFSLEQHAVEVTGVTVRVEQTPIVPRDQVTSKMILQGEMIQVLPVDVMTDMLRLQPGVVEGRGGNLTLRGGRPGEAATYIDGALVRSLTGAQTISVGSNALVEVSVTTGAMGAEYGEAQSGVVSLVTRSGDQRLRGNLAFLTDEPAGQVYGTGLYAVEGSLGGPLARNLTFFLAGTIGGQQNGRRNTGAEGTPIYVLNSFDDSVMVARTPGSSTSDSQMVYLPAFARYSEGSRRPWAWSNNHTLDGKLQYTFGAGSRVSVSGHQTRNQGLNYPGRGGLYNPMAQSGFWNLSNALILNWTQNLAQSAGRALFVDATFSWQHDQGITGPIEPGWVNDHKTPFLWFTLSRPAFITTFENFPVDDRLVQNVRVNNCQSGRDAANPAMGGCVPFIYRNDLAGAGEYRFNPYGISAGASYYPTTGVNTRGGPQLQAETRLTGRVNLDWQANRYNRIRFGGDFVKSQLKFFVSNLTSQIFLDAYIEDPVRYGLYASDRIDLGDVVLDLGLRFDRMDSRIQYPRSPARTFNDPIRTGDLSTAFSAADTAMANACAAALTAADTTAWSTCNFYRARPHSVIAPSLRVSFPVTDRTGFRLSYAHQLQSPSFTLLATGANTDVGFSNTNDIFARDLDFGRTIMFEFGVRHAFSDDMVLDMSAYNKDKVSDIAARIMPVWDPFKRERQNLNLLTNADFGNVRGVDIKLDRRIGQLFQGTIAYTYQTAKGTGSDPYEYLNTISRSLSIVTGERAPPPQALLTSADNRVHTIAGNLALNFPAGWRSGTVLGAILQGFGFHATFQFASGLPYTRIINTGAGTTGPGNGFGNSYTGTERLNSGTMPWVKNVDLRVTRGLQVAGLDLTLFVDTRNLFNWTNLTRIFAETGDVMNSRFREFTLSPVVSSLQQEAGDRWETRAVGGESLQGVDLGTTRADCAGYAPTWFYGVPNCVMLQRAETRFGNGDGFFDTREMDVAFGAWYDAVNGRWASYGPGFTIRFGFEVDF